MRGVDVLFKELDDVKMSMILYVREEYRGSLLEMVGRLKELEVPLEFLSGLVNVRRGIEDLPRNTHYSWGELCEDACIIRSDYLFGVVLCSLIAVGRVRSYRDRLGKVVIPLEEVCWLAGVGCGWFVSSFSVVDLDCYCWYLRSFRGSEGVVPLGNAPLV